ncbi:MAG: hypothetical protein M1830_003390 [Pleopsidium flavum]|nr:MAG: hypothetical protein M1830_003390 [Pleopsidium flavum]
MTALSINPLVNGYSFDQEVLSDERIQQLLIEAEQRLNVAHPEMGAPSIASEQAPPHVTSKGTPETQIRFPKLQPGDVARPYIVSDGVIARVDSARLLSRRDRDHSGAARRVVDPVVLKETMEKQKKATAGPDWFNLPQTNLTPELKRDLQLLQLRSVLDPKRHYKKESGRARAREFSQVGTILEGPTEFYSARLSQRDRKKTLVEEVLAGEETSGRFKSKYNDIQATKTSGKKAYYKNLKTKRSSSIRKS